MCMYVVCYDLQVDNIVVVYVWCHHLKDSLPGMLIVCFSVFFWGVVIFFFFFFFFVIVAKVRLRVRAHIGTYPSLE